jgi:hypothetical protein
VENAEANAPTSASGRGASTFSVHPRENSMQPNFARCLNKTIFVSIPALFEDVACRAYKLVGVEFSGLWLQSDELTHRLLSEDMKDIASMAPVVFVPFTQIAGVLIATSVPPPKASEASPPKPTTKKN